MGRRRGKRLMRCEEPSGRIKLEFHAGNQGTGPARAAGWRWRRDGGQGGERESGGDSKDEQLNE